MVIEVVGFVDFVGVKLGERGLSLIGDRLHWNKSVVLHSIVERVHSKVEGVHSIGLGDSFIGGYCDFIKRVVGMVVIFTLWRCTSRWAVMGERLSLNGSDCLSRSSSVVGEGSGAGAAHISSELGLVVGSAL